MSFVSAMFTSVKAATAFVLPAAFVVASPTSIGSVALVIAVVPASVQFTPSVKWWLEKSAPPRTSRTQRGAPRLAVFVAVAAVVRRIHESRLSVVTPMNASTSAAPSAVRAMMPARLDVVLPPLRLATRAITSHEVPGIDYLTK